MTTTTIRPGGTQRDGHNRSRSTVYATSQTGGTITNTNLSTPMITGQQFSTPNYDTFEAVAQADCSSIAVGQAVTRARLEWTFGVSSTASDIKVIAGSGAGASVDAADYIDATTLGAKTLYATLAAASVVSSTTVQIDLNAAGIAAVQAAVDAAGYFEYMVASSNTIAATTPTADERVRIESSEHATAGSRPALIVDHVSRPILTTHYLNQMAG